MAIPNPAAEEAPAGGEDDFVVLETVGTPRDFAAEGFEPRDHIELGKILGAIDIDRGAKVSGLAVLLPHRRRRRARVRADQPGDGAGPRGRLHPGDRARRWSSPRRWTAPASSARRPTTSTGSRARTSTWSAPRRCRWRRTTPTRSSTAPRCRCATPRSARASARRPARTARTPRASSGCTGSTRSRCSSTPPPRTSYAEHQRLLDWEKEFLDKLELAYRVIDVAAGDLGLSAQRKFDCEAWIPTQGKYRELTSTSNCTEFQTRRLDTRGRFDGQDRRRSRRSTAPSAR